LLRFSRRLQALNPTTILVVVGLLGFQRLPQAQSNQSPGTLVTLHDAVTLALAKSPIVLNAQNAREQAALSMRLADSAFSFKVLPSALGSFGQNNLSNQNYGVSVSQKLQGGTELRGNVGATSLRNQLGTYYNSDTTFEVRQPLLRGFGRSVTALPLFDAQWRTLDANWQLGLAEQQIALEVATTYYAIVVQTRLLGVAETALARANGLRDASIARLATGRVSQLDVLRAQQLASQSEAQVVDAQGSLADAQDRLSVLIGQRPGTPFTVSDTVPEDVEDLDLDQAGSLAFEHRTEVRSAQAASDESLRTIAAAKNQLRPQVDLNLAVTRQETSDSLRFAFGLDQFHAATFAAVSMPLNRTVEEVGLQNAVIERSRRERDVSAWRDRVAQEARQAVRRQQRAVKSLALARTSLDLAQREVEVATLRFQRGLSNNLDLVSAQATLRGAESQEVAARAEVALARLGVRAATGVLDPRRDIN